MAKPVWPAVEQRIRLDAGMAEGRLVAPRLLTTRNGSIAGALAARPLEEVPALLAHVFPLCGMAHAVAGLSAIEQALGVEISPAQTAFRDLVVLAEHGAALGWRILMDWLPALGDDPGLQACADIRWTAATLNGVAKQCGWLKIGGARLRLDRNALAREVGGLAQHLIALFPEAADPALSFDALEQSLQTGDSVPARMIRAVRSRLPEGYGRHDQALLGTRDAGWFGARLAADSGFSDAPTLDGRPAEVGPLSSRRHPLVGEALARWDASLAARLLAAALDVVVVAERLRRIIDRLADDDPRDPDITRAGCGAGMAETARGPLAYYAQVEGGRLGALRSVAPTEWNFHSHGPFLAALEAAPSLADPVAAARLLVAGFDPCVPFEIAVEAEALPHA
ncbi:MAG: hypothetical protein KGJ78_06790 [Alphaproteobacteria bacterium]|nr:hypothetical protein [Alphaproteobacteria bacterium]